VSISRIHISNFKSFGQGVEVDLHRLNVLIGVNASGKSNFVEAFDFLRDLAKDGLESAISYSSGGIDYLKNLRSQPKDPIELEVTAELKYKGKSGRTVGAFKWQSRSDRDRCLRDALQIRPLADQRQSS
jgi:AAA15 family ATPase/GTPase